MSALATPPPEDAPQERRRGLRSDFSVPALIIALLLITVAGTRCGHTAKSEKGPADGGSGSKATGGTSPTDWDGLSDWAGSKWEVVDE